MTTSGPSARPGDAPDSGSDGADAAEGRSEKITLARQGTQSLGSGILGALLKFAITLLLARLFGRTGVGIYYQAFAFLAVVTALASGGFSNALIRFVPLYRADGDDAGARGVIRLALYVPTAATVVLGGALIAFAPWIAETWFGQPAMTTPLRLIGVALPATIFTDIALAATRGFKVFKPTNLIQQLFEPSARLALSVAAFLLGAGVTGAIVALVVTNFLAAGFAGAALARQTRGLTAPPRYEPRKVFSFASLTWGIYVTQTGLRWADTVILGIIVQDAAIVGLYNVATRLLVLSQIFHGPLNMVFTPRISGLFRQKKTELLNQTFRLVTTWLLRLSLPSCVILILFASQLLSFFGGRFVVDDAALVTAILAGASIVGSSAGPNGPLLPMSGRPGINLVNNVVQLSFNVGLNLILIPPYGIVGAAIAWAASIVLGNAVRLTQVWVILRMHPWDMTVAKTLMAGAVSFAAGLLVQLSMTGRAGLAVGVAVVVATYLAALVALGISSDDRLFIAALRTRLGRLSPRGA